MESDQPEHELKKGTGKSNSGTSSYDVLNNNSIRKPSLRFERSAFDMEAYDPAALWKIGGAFSFFHFYLEYFKRRAPLAPSNYISKKKTSTAQNK